MFQATWLLFSTEPVSIFCKVLFGYYSQVTMSGCTPDQHDVTIPFTILPQGKLLGVGISCRRSCVMITILKEISSWMAADRSTLPKRWRSNLVSMRLLMKIYRDVTSKQWPETKCHRNVWFKRWMSRMPIKRLELGIAFKDAFYTLRLVVSNFELIVACN